MNLDVCLRRITWDVDRNFNLLGILHESRCPVATGCLSDSYTFSKLRCPAATCRHQLTRLAAEASLISNPEGLEHRQEETGGCKVSGGGPGGGAKGGGTPGLGIPAAATA